MLATCLRMPGGRSGWLLANGTGIERSCLYQFGKRFGFNSRLFGGIRIYFWSHLE